VPARVGALVRSLASGTSLQPVCLQDATGGLTVHLLLEPGADAERLARLASSLYRIVEVGAEPGGIGPVQSIAVRLGSQRIVVQPVTVGGGPAALLVAATDHRPGLTRLQLERVAARLGGTPS
jgi:predicted regulator of Ras-like GTPase activity (Roadblock/LC7/MglB family)